MTLDTTAAVGAIAAKTRRKPKIAVILGSGLGGLAKDVQEATRIHTRRSQGSSAAPRQVTPASSSSGRSRVKMSP